MRKNRDVFLADVRQNSKKTKNEMDAAKPEMARAGIARAAAWGPIMLSCDPICERRAQNRGQNRDQTEVKTEIKSCACAQVPTLFPHLPMRARAAFCVCFSRKTEMRK